LSRAKLGLESESNNDEVLPFNKDEDDELAVVAEGPITPPTEVDSEKDCI
jgi:hypothetical protein